MSSRPIQSSGSTSYPDFTPHEASERPWKYLGYRVFPSWLATDDAFCIVRKFGALNMRAILNLQNDLVELEKKLEIRDQINSRKGMKDTVDNGSFTKDDDDVRKKTLETITQKLERYNSFVNSYATLVARPEVHKDDHRNVEEWLKNHQVKYNGVDRFAIHPDEASYIRNKDDLIPIHPKQRSWFRNVLEKMALLSTPCLRCFLGRKPMDIEKVVTQVEEKGTTTLTAWHNERRVEKFSASIISVVGLCMIIGPLWVLNYVQPSVYRLAIISSFIVVFFVLVGVATTARIFEVLAAAAAYAAVLMVFMQLTSAAGH